MKMPPIEKVYLDKIVASSGMSLDVVRDLFKALLISMLQEIYATYGNSENKNKTLTEYHIPYIGKLLIKCENVLIPDSGEKTNVTIKAEPSLILVKEINRIFSDESLEMEEFFKDGICLSLMNILGISKDTPENGKE